MVALRTIQKSPWRPDDINQYKDLLTGVLQGQAITIKTADDVTAFLATLQSLDTTNGRVLKILKPDSSTGLQYDINGLTIDVPVSITDSLSVAGGPIYNAVAFGADNTGVVAADSIISNIIAAMPSEGGVLYFPAGVYLVNAPIVIDQAMTVMGDGPNLSYIQSSSATANVFTVTTASGSYNRFSNFGITKTAGGMPSTNGAGIAFALTAGTSASAPIFENLWIGNQYNGLNLLNVATPKVIGCSFVESTFSGIRNHFDYSPFGAGDLIINNCYFANSIIGSTAGVRINGGAGFLIGDSKFIGFGTPILLDIVTGLSNLTDLMVWNNSIEGQPTTPTLITMTGASDFANILIADNQMVINGSGTAISVDSSSGTLSKIKISGNLIDCNSTSTGMGFADGDDIYITDNDISIAAGATAFVNSAATNIRRGLNNVVGAGTLQTGTWTHIQPKIQMLEVTLPNTNAGLGNIFKGTVSGSQSWPDAFKVTPHTILTQPVNEGALTAVIDSSTATAFTAHSVGAANATGYTYRFVGLADG